MSLIVQAQGCTEWGEEGGFGSFYLEIESVGQDICEGVKMAADRMAGYKIVCK